jgi:CubicO group peptidase (beta-lactamase class C family)
VKPAYHNVWTILLLLLAAVPGRAGEVADLKPQVDRLVQPLLDSRTVVGLVVGLSREGKTAVWGYGKTACNSDQTPDGQTVFEIGSVTKVFTALTLADMVQEGRVGLDDPVSSLLPETVHVPTRNDRVITLLDLATHTSGLPRIPQNLLLQIAQRPGNPYAAYTVEQLYEGLAATSLASKPGERYAYSNLGMALLGHALARRAGVSYEAAVHEQICKPLGMNDTQITLAAPLRSRFAQGHNLDCRPVSAWDFPTLPGAGAMRSTVNDLLRFVAANLGLYPTRLAAAIEATHVPRHKANDSLSIALAWHLDTKKGTVWHNGETGGFHSFVSFQKDRKVGVVVLCNTVGGAADKLGEQAMSVLLGEKVEPLKLRTPVRLDPATLDQYVGTYQAITGLDLAVFRDGDRLLVQATGQQALGIYPESETEFFYRAVDARITFVKDQAGKVTKLVLHQHGLDFPAWKGGIGFRLGTGLLKALRGQPENKAQDR